MTRFRYWKLTSDEVKKLTHNPDKVLNWEIKGVRKPEVDANSLVCFCTVMELHIIMRH